MMSIGKLTIKNLGSTLRLIHKVILIYIIKKPVLKASDIDLKNAIRLKLKIHTYSKFTF